MIWLHIINLKKDMLKKPVELLTITIFRPIKVATLFWMISKGKFLLR